MIRHGRRSYVAGRLQRQGFGMLRVVLPEGPGQRELGGRIHRGRVDVGERAHDRVDELLLWRRNGVAPPT